ncbi:MAG: hypothetical protein ACP5M0_05280 [Desulfomonilaceae bacterium]
MGHSHIRGISTTLSLLDKTLCEFEEFARGREIRSVLYEIENPLTTEQRENILQLMKAMWETLREIRDELKLEKTVRSADKMILGSCSTNWVSLLELQGNQLRRYGEIPDGLVEYLDPKANFLTETLRQVARITAQSRR